MAPHRLITLLSLSGFCAILSACATTTSPSPSPSRTTTRQDSTRQQMTLNLASGVYRCEENQRVEIDRDSANSITLNWQGHRRTLQRQDSNSGLPRYEDRENGLLWIDLPWKSVLMDVNNGRPLANDCKAARS